MGFKGFYRVLLAFTSTFNWLQVKCFWLGWWLDTEEDETLERTISVNRSEVDAKSADINSSYGFLFFHHFDSPFSFCVSDRRWPVATLEVNRTRWWIDLALPWRFFLFFFFGVGTRWWPIWWLPLHHWLQLLFNLSATLVFPFPFVSASPPRPHFPLLSEPTAES